MIAQTDSTNVRANADIDSLTPRFYQDAKQQAQAHVTDLFATDRASREPDNEPLAPDAPAAPTDSSDTPAAVAATGATGLATPVAWPFAGTPVAEH